MFMAKKSLERSYPKDEGHVKRRLHVVFNALQSLWMSLTILLKSILRRGGFIFLHL